MKLSRTRKKKTRG